MANYFNFFPKTVYTLSDKPIGVDSVTNIVTRFKFENSLKGNFAIFYEYVIQDGDTPEIIAQKYYGNPEKHWIVLLFNDIIDPQFDWPLDYRTFNRYVDEKYSSSKYANTPCTGISGLSWALNQNNVHSYYKIVTQKSSENTFVDKLEVSETTYSNNQYMMTGTSRNYLLEDGTAIEISYSREKKTYYEYESEENEKKRKIKLLKKEFVPQVEKEFRRIIL